MVVKGTVIISRKSRKGYMNVILSGDDLIRVFSRNPLPKGEELELNLQARGLGEIFFFLRGDDGVDGKVDSADLPL